MYYQQQEEKKEGRCDNPRNRFMFLFCKTYEVDVGWGCGCCGCRLCPFSLGIYIFGLFMIIQCIKDIYNVVKNDYLNEDSDKTFAAFFYVKIVGDCLCVLGGFIGGFSSWRFRYIYSVVAYYIVFLSFILNTIFLIYVITKITSLKFWSNIGFTKIFTVILWYFYEYIWLVFLWLLFCNMVDIYRKKQKEAQKSPTEYQLGF